MNTVNPIKWDGCMADIEYFMNNHQRIYPITIHKNYQNYVMIFINIIEIRLTITIIIIIITITTTQRLSFLYN